MKRLSTFSFFLLSGFYFCVGSALVFIGLTSLIERLTTESVENTRPPDYEVLALTKNDVQIVTLKNLEEFKRQNPDFSFLISKGTEYDITTRIFDKMRNKSEQDKGPPIFTVEAEQISEGRQLITLSSDDTRSRTTNTYEATQQEVFPKTTMWTNFRYTPFKMLGSFIAGTAACLIFFFIYGKYNP